MGEKHGSSSWEEKWRHKLGPLSEHRSGIDHSPQIQFLLNKQQADRDGIVLLGIQRCRPLASKTVTDSCLNGTNSIC